MTDMILLFSGIDGYEKNINDMLRVPFDYCVPSIQVEGHTLRIVDLNPIHVLVMHVFPSTQVITEQGDDVYVGTGDKSKNSILINVCGEFTHVERNTLKMKLQSERFLQIRIWNLCMHI